MMRALRDGCDAALAVLKWPFALLALLALPMLVVGTYYAFASLELDAVAFTPFALGAVGYVILWWAIFRRPAFGTLLSTFEHEFTHAIFAWLTFHKVVGLSATWRQGGAMKFQGKGNWLITIAPYFFPTISVAAAIVLVFAPDAWRTPVLAVLGVTVGYHLTSTFHETHREQTDLQRVGFIFALCALPALNILLYGFLILWVSAPNGARTWVEGMGAGWHWMLSLV